MKYLACKQSSSVMDFLFFPSPLLPSVLFLCRSVILRMTRRACITLLRVWWLCRHCMERSLRSLAKENVQGWVGQHRFCPLSSTCSHIVRYISTQLNRNTPKEAILSVLGYNDVPAIQSGMFQKFIHNSHLTESHCRHLCKILHLTWTGFSGSSGKCTITLCMFSLTTKGKQYS